MAKVSDEVWRVPSPYSALSRCRGDYLPGYGTLV